MKTVEEAKANLANSVTYIPDRYKAGVARSDWQTAAGSDQAERNFADSMAKAITAKRRQANVKKVSNSEWQSRAIEKGGAVIGERIRSSLDKQSANWAPIYTAVQSDINRLAPRTTDFRTNITNRVVGTVESWKKHSGKL